MYSKLLLINQIKSISYTILTIRNFILCSLRTIFANVVNYKVAINPFFQFIYFEKVTFKTKNKSKKIDF